MSFDVQVFLETKRDGREHAPGDLEAFVQGLQSGKIPDYQVAAWLMAAFLRGLSGEERRALTEALANSGQRLSLPGGQATVDKHSTGGVGDKTTLVLVPLVASCGVPVAKLSGRGLGFTGGTVDKLDAIPGMRTHLTLEAFRDQVERIGCAVSGHSAALAPAEGKLYALRDVTATVPSKDLITTSIVSKKIAGGARAFVYDVKWGSGALMERYEDAEDLARLLVDLSVSLGHPARALLTDMNQPLGEWVGNAAEVREALEILSDRGPASTREVTLALGGEMLALAGAASDPETGRRLCEESLRTGRARDRFGLLLEAQGGDRRILEDPSPPSPGSGDPGGARHPFRMAGAGGHPPPGGGGSPPGRRAVGPGGPDRLRSGAAPASFPGGSGVGGGLPGHPAREEFLLAGGGPCGAGGGLRDLLGARGTGGVGASAPGMISPEGAPSRDDEAALENHLIAFLPLVRRWARRLCGGDEAFREDLIQEGLVGILKGIQSFTPSKGTSGPFPGDLRAQPDALGPAPVSSGPSSLASPGPGGALGSVALGDQPLGRRTWSGCGSL